LHGDGFISVFEHTLDGERPVIKFNISNKCYGGQPQQFGNAEPNNPDITIGGLPSGNDKINITEFFRRLG
jgi:hypothetical protein